MGRPAFARSRFHGKNYGVEHFAMRRRASADKRNPILIPTSAHLRSIGRAIQNPGRHVVLVHRRTRHLAGGWARL